MDKTDIAVFLGIIPLIFLSVIAHEYTHYQLAECNGGISDFLDRFELGSISPQSTCFGLACIDIADCENYEAGAGEFYPTLVSLIIPLFYPLIIYLYFFHFKLRKLQKP